MASHPAGSSSTSAPHPRPLSRGERGGREAPLPGGEGRKRGPSPGRRPTALSGRRVKHAGGRGEPVSLRVGQSARGAGEHDGRTALPGADPSERAVERACGPLPAAGGARLRRRRHRGPLRRLDQPAEPVARILDPARGGGARDLPHPALHLRLADPAARAGDVRAPGPHPRSRLRRAPRRGARPRAAGRSLLRHDGHRKLVEPGAPRALSRVHRDRGPPPLQRGELLRRALLPHQGSDHEPAPRPSARALPS